MVDSTERLSQRKLTNSEMERLQNWVREAGKLFIEERQRSSSLAAELTAQQQLSARQDAKLWLLEETVATLKQELQALAAAYNELQRSQARLVTPPVDDEARK